MKLFRKSMISKIKKLHKFYTTPLKIYLVRMFVISEYIAKVLEFSAKQLME